jgi:hypothetical protein
VFEAFDLDATSSGHFHRLLVALQQRRGRIKLVDSALKPGSAKTLPD